MQTIVHWQPPQRRRIYLVRHGDVSYFDANGRPARPDLVPLNQEGRAQIESLRRELAQVAVDRIVTSDLPRCVETADLLSVGFGLRPELCPDLQEIRPGRLMDIPQQAMEQVFLRGFGQGADRHSQFLAGESFGSLVDRVLVSFQRLISEPNWRNLLVIAHGGVNRAILTHVMGTGIPGFATIEQDPGCLNIFDVDDAGQFQLRLLNHTPYSPAKKGLELTTMERLYIQYRGSGSVSRSD